MLVLFKVFITIIIKTVYSTDFLLSSGGFCVKAVGNTAATEPFPNSELWMAMNCHTSSTGYFQTSEEPCILLRSALAQQAAPLFHPYHHQFYQPVGLCCLAPAQPSRPGLQPWLSCMSVY